MDGTPNDDLDPSLAPEQLLDPARDPRAPVRAAVARHPAAPPAALCRLAADGNFWVRKAAGVHPALPASWRERLRRAGSTADLAGFAAPDPGLAPSALAELAAAGEWGRRLAARHPATPVALLLELGTDSSPLLRADLAAHPRAPARLLGRLLEDADPQVRRAAARHPRAPATRIDRLRRAGATAELDEGEQLQVVKDDGGGRTLQEPTAADRRGLTRGGPFARRLAARLPGLAPRHLERLAADPDPEVCRRVAEHPGCPPRALAGLARDGGGAGAGLEWALAMNPACPLEVLAEFLGRAEEEDVELAVALAGHPAASAALLSRLAGHGAARVRQAVARHPALPSSTRTLFRRAGSAPDLVAFADPDPTLPPAALAGLARAGTWARRLAARHPATPPAALARLLADADLFVRQQAARHPQASPEVLEALRRAGSAADLDGFEDPSVSLPSLFSSDLTAIATLGPWGRRLAARHPACPPSLLAELATDADPQVRAAVAAHPATPAEAVEALAGDAASAVRWAVVRRPDLPPAALAVLSRDSVATLRAAVARHPALPAAALRSLCRDLDEDVRTAAAGRLVPCPQDVE